MTSHSLWVGLNLVRHGHQLLYTGVGILEWHVVSVKIEVQSFLTWLEVLLGEELRPDSLAITWGLDVAVGELVALGVGIDLLHGVLVFDLHAVWIHIWDSFKIRSDLSLLVQFLSNDCGNLELLAEPLGLHLQGLDGVGL